MISGNGVVDSNGGNCCPGLSNSGGNCCPGSVCGGSCGIGPGSTCGGGNIGTSGGGFISKAGGENDIGSGTNGGASKGSSGSSGTAGGRIKDGGGDNITNGGDGTGGGGDGTSGGGGDGDGGGGDGTKGGGGDSASGGGDGISGGRRGRQRGGGLDIKGLFGEVRGKGHRPHLPNRYWYSGSQFCDPLTGLGLPPSPTLRPPPRLPTLPRFLSGIRVRVLLSTSNWRWGLGGWVETGSEIEDVTKSNTRHMDTRMCCCTPIIYH
ncbi:hypothetical protein Hanom_Chr08g00682991 [Helianthus anomalus]